MKRFSISQLTTMRWSFHQDVVRYLIQGFHSIGIWRHKIEDFDLLEVADYLQEMKMNVSSVHWAGGFTGGDGATFSDAIQDALDAIEITSRLQGGCLIVHPGCRNGHISNHARRLFRSALQTLVPVASDYGVRLAIELMPCPSANNWTFMQRIQCAMELINDFPEEQLGIVLDLYHVGLNEQVFDAVPEFASRLALVQLADRADQDEPVEHRLLLGEGNVPIEKWFQQLNRAGYSGLYEVELHGTAISEINYRERLKSVSNFFGPEFAGSKSEPIKASSMALRSFNRKVR
jgi:sugar phosphate isomerase/epimerase